MEKYLKKHPLLRTVDPLILTKAVSNRFIYSHHYRKGTTLHNAGSRCDTLDIVQSGTAIAYSLDINGNSLTMFAFHDGDLIGANLLFAENNMYPLNIYCEADSAIIHIRKTALEGFLADTSFTRTFIRYLSNITQNVNRKLFIVSGKSLRERIMEYLLTEAASQKSPEIRLPVSKKQLADILGVQRPSLFRELKKMRDEGLLDYTNRIITLR